MRPHILYWKWNEDVFEEGVLERKLYDIIQRSMFNYIYVSFHFIKKEHKLLVCDKLIKKIEKAAQILEENGRHLIVDLDIRHEKQYYEQNEHKEKLYSVFCITGNLDENGCCVMPAKEARDVLNCWAVGKLNGVEFSGTPMEMKSFTNVQDEMLHISGAKEYAGQSFICYVIKTQNLYDIFGEEFKSDRRKLFERVKHIKISGVAVDEWGADIQKRLPTIDEKLQMNSHYDQENSYIFSRIDKEVDLSTLQMYVEWMNYSDGMEKTYQERYGRTLRDDFLYLWHYPEGQLQKSVSMIDRYLENIRLSTVMAEAEFYELGKEYFGEQCFIACHPTWWGDELDNAFDCLKNGLDWWEVKRDYAQTDEEIIIPIRLAMMRKCPENVWYNMWYSMRTMDIRTYYRETWINARFGGRTHHLGYECNEPNVVLELYPEGMLESISVMEEKIEELNYQITSAPDSRVLVLFGYEASTNWKHSGKDAIKLERRNKNMHNILAFTKELFNYPYLCELAPTIEIANGSITLENNKIAYKGHKYDAVILLLGNGMQLEAYELLNSYASNGGVLLTVGDIRVLKDGNKADMNFPIKGRFDENVDAKTVAEKMLELGIPQMSGSNYCCYEDGSIVYTTDGEKNINNPLSVELEVGDRNVKVDCLDYFIKRA